MSSGEEKNKISDVENNDSSLKQTVPQETELRRRFVGEAAKYVAECSLVPPLTLDELYLHADRLIERLQEDTHYRDFAVVVIYNALWRDVFAAVPYSRRVLMLPQCLRKNDKCTGEFDEMGLVCRSCGACAIGRLLDEAEELGYVTLVAEGTTVVTGLLESGKVDAVLGASCLSVMERTWPHLSREAIPALAVPLLKDGCVETEVDEEWLRELMLTSTGGKWQGRIDFETIRAEVRGWFSRVQLSALVTKDDSVTAKEALSWLADNGKRWRPVLAVSAYEALAGSDREEQYPEFLKKTAIAVECFHKASLVHDDIEDDDAERYGAPTVHERLGIPQAINVGDYLIGLGYRLLAESGVEDRLSVKLLQAASRGHTAMCLGQGRELDWLDSSNPCDFDVDFSLSIFRGKTAPAFGVALVCGAALAGADDETLETLWTYSDALGIAYQIRDDIDDFHEDSNVPGRPGLLLALACDKCGAGLMAGYGEHGDEKSRARTREVFRAAVNEHELLEHAGMYLEHYRNQAVRSLSVLKNSHLKTLLQRIASRILG